MDSEGVKRKLTTILAADVEGYSRLMSADEEATLKTLKSYREIIDGLIGKHDGRIFATGGDSVFAEFGSAVEAARCAISIQEELGFENAELAEDQQMKFRIGLNLGDVMVEGDNLYGDGVNVAARLEGLAEPQGICISGSAFEQVRDKLEIGFEDLGDQQVKNIDRPIRAYRVLTDPAEARKFVTPPAKRTTNWKMPAIAAAIVIIITAGGLAWWQPWVTRVEAASVDRMAFPLPDKPSIAVLPFENLSGDAKQDSLSDGISENITTALTRIAEMFVIARTSTRTYKGKPVKVQQVAEELGVRYVLEGSVQRSGDQVRVTAQLIDALTGRHLWAERYDREVEDAFALQDDIALNVVVALEVELTDGDRARLFRGNTNNLEAYQLNRRGFRLLFRFTKDDNAAAQRLFQKAVELDPNYSAAWMNLGLAHQFSAKRGWGEDRAQDQARAIELAHKAMAIDPSSPGPYALLANISGGQRRYDEAIAYSEKAISLAPNSADLVAGLGRTLVLTGQPEKGLSLIKRARRLSPFAPPNILRYEGEAYHAIGRYEEAIAAFERARTRNPKGTPALVWLARTYADLGRTEEARAAAQEVLKLSPGFSAKSFVNSALPFKDRTKSERALATLLEVGLPE